MALPLTPLTELDAVNSILMLIGEQPVNTLELPGISEVSIARGTLHQISRSVQTEGLYFNTERDYPIPPDLDGNINLPPNTLRVVNPDPYTDYVMRGNRLYDRRNHTYKFDKPVKLDIVLFLPFDQLPQTARDYITIRAAREFQARVLGSDLLHALSEADERDAYLAMVREEFEVEQYNLLDNPQVRLSLRRR